MKWFLSPLFLVSIILSHAQVKLPRLISDNMVLQRNTPIRIWGWAAPREQVRIRFMGKEYSTTTTPEKTWTLTLPAVKAGGPYDMDIDASNHLTIKNILIGDVWVCSGQSNMELPMERVKEKYPQVIAQSKNDVIRQFNVSTRFNFLSPQQDLESGSWVAASPETVLSFTAVGYFFARDLYEKYHVPIGLIKAAVGGSPADAWLSEEALQTFPQSLAAAMRHRAPGYIDSIRKREQAIRDAWYYGIWQNDKGLHDSKPWYDPGFDASNWSSMTVPGYWADQGLKGVNGVVWFRKEIDVPASMTGQAARLLLGRIIDQDSVYVNGQFAGTIGYQYPPRRYTLPAGMLKPGKNTIVVRVINSGGKGGFVTDKPYQLIVGEQTIDLTGSWQYQLGTTARPLPSQTFFQYQPMGLFNGIVAPLLPYRIKGVIWYQGEANASKPAEYYPLFTTLINNWRQKWGQGNFPFLYVQLANYLAVHDQPTESNWALLREAQLKTLALPNTGMAVITDVGEWNDIHPLNKEDVGKRLALAAQKVAYNDKSVVYSGPLYRSMKIQGNKVVLHFANAGSGLMAKGSDTLKHFAIAGADKKFVWAQAIIKGNTVVVWSDQVPAPVAVRYAWADNPGAANLYNKEGLPASAFRTDNW
jgi:sialate O-acetylesterase